MSKAKLHIVHCIDTEGPLSETIEATFDRLYDSKGIRLNPSIETLEKLQNKKNTLFCGSYFGYGFHEDGIKSTIEMLKTIND